LAVKALTVAPRFVRRTAAWLLTAVFVLTAWIVLTDSPQRGWRVLRAVAWQDRDRLYPYTGRPIFVAN
ncbi:MAG: hypothetical protein GTN84_04170, partial [Hydrogenophaga sp.]|uniref:hypothetical protein n=1 Tax=Hydrogenophaga sp. TaxID=1904254 RepID=UPI0016963A2E